MKTALEFLPLAAFFVAYQLWGLMAATVVLMLGTVLTILIIYLKHRKIPLNPLITAVIVGVFGSLTLLLNDATFIKMKPTVLNLLFAAILAGGMLNGKSLLKSLLQDNLPLTEQGWRILTWRWAGFFVFLAGLNEYIWRHYSEGFWVNFKVFGMLPLTLLFLITQLPLIQRHLIHNTPEN